jgi:chaperonin GroEL (HSP60 family)
MVFVNISKAQDDDVGDGTKVAAFHDDILQKGIHLQTVVENWQLAQEHKNDAFDEQVISIDDSNHANSK